MKLKKQKVLTITALISCLFGLLGFSIISFFAYSSLNEYAKQGLTSISSQIEAILSDTVNSYKIQLGKHANSCEQFLPPARKLILRTPYLRSVTLTNDQHILCSTIDMPNITKLALPKELSYHSPGNNRLSYLEDSPLVKRTSVFLFEIHLEQHNVLFGIHGILLTNILKTAKGFYQPKIIIRDKVISVHGLTKQKTNRFQKHFQIDNQLYKLSYSLTSENYIKYALLNYSPLYFALICITFALSIFLYHSLSIIDWLVFSIRGGINRNEFHPYLQPVFDQNGQLAGCEVLVRWFHHKKGMIAPDMFIHSAEKSAQIDEIFTHLLKEVTNKFYPVQSLIPDGFHTAFNVSAPQLLSSNLIHDCKKFIYSLNKCNHQLVIELTERVEIPDSLEYISTIDKLKSMGVKIALDDFGTGHSSLRYIKKIKIDFLKIDKSFTDMIDNHSDEYHIVENVLDLAQRIGVPTIVEGVEEQIQSDYLLKRNVNYFQGYLYGKPMPIDDFISLYFRPGS